MTITALVENYSHGELKARHGLSLYIETEKHHLLFDLGMGNTLFDNAKTRGIDLSQVDTVIISHGHGDHGGGLGRFLDINSRAKVYVQRSAFDPHYTKLAFFKVNVGLKASLADHPQVVLLDGDHQIDDELSLCGFHLYNPIGKKSAPTALLDEIIGHLSMYPDTEFYPCHCTGKEAFGYLSKHMPNMHYLSCGETVGL